MAQEKNGSAGKQEQAGQPAASGPAPGSTPAPDARAAAPAPGGNIAGKSASAEQPVKPGGTPQPGTFAQSKAAGAYDTAHPASGPAGRQPSSGPAERQPVSGPAERQPVSGAAERQPASGSVAQAAPAATALGRAAASPAAAQAAQAAGQTSQAGQTAQTSQPVKASALSGSSGGPSGSSGASKAPAASTTGGAGEVQDVEFTVAGGEGQVPSSVRGAAEESIMVPGGDDASQMSDFTAQNTRSVIPARESKTPAWALEPEPSQVDFHPPMLQCIALLFKMYGQPVSANVIASRLPSGQASHRPTAILRAAKGVGMESNIIAKSSLENISHMTLPCILMLQNEGACVLVDYDRDNARVIFPEQGAPVNLSREELDKEYIGYAVFAKLEGKLDERASKVKLLKTTQWFWGTLTSFMPIYKHVLSCSLITNLLTLCGPLFFMNVYDKVLPNKLNAVDTLWALAIGIVIAYIFDFLLKNLRSYFVDLAGKNADIILASKLMQQVLNMRLDAKPESTGSLANNLREFESLREFFSSSTMTVLVDLPFLFIFLGVIFFIGGPMVLVLVAAIPIVILIGIMVQFPMQHSAEKGFKENMQKNALLVELINGLETVKTSMAEGRMMNAWEKVVGMSALSSADSKRMANLSITSSMMLTQLVSVGLIIVGVYRFSEGLITMGGIIACNMLAGRAMAPLSQMAGMFSRLQQSRMALKALDQLMQLPTENVANDSYVEFGHLEHSLTMEELSFKYPNNERYSLEKVSLMLRPGEKVGIIGAMGSGKSTLGRLCVGLYQPSEGAVKMGGVDIRQLDTTTLRSRFGYVSQDNYLFYGTVRENIAFGAPNVDDRMILRAANIAGVTDFVRSNPVGFGMQVGERGMNLSGGQRQSVAIARALLRDPDILILDEPSSNMDNYSENMLKHRLATTMGNKTVVIITHRLSMLDLVQRLVVMDQGRIYADGPKEKVLNFLKQEQQKSASKRSTAPNRQGGLVKQ